MRSSILVSLVAALSTPSAAILAKPQSSSKDATLNVLQTIPDVQNLENLAVRQNGDILVTSSTSASLHLVASKGNRVDRIANIPGVTALTGIAELEKDVFYVAGANITGPDPIATGTNAVWRVDLRGFETAEDGTIVKPAKLSLVIELPSAGLLNGMTRLSPKDASHLLISDSALGHVVLLNVRTKVHETVIENETTTGLPERLVAINGIRTHGHHVFYVNQVRALFAKLPISLLTGHADGPPEVIVNGTLPFADDFTLSQDGKRAWIALNSQNVVVEVDIPAKTSTIVVNSTELGEGSSAAVVPGHSSGRSLYVTGSSDVNGSSVGAIFRVDLQ